MMVEKNKDEDDETFVSKERLVLRPVSLCRDLLKLEGHTFYMMEIPPGHSTVAVVGTLHAFVIILCLPRLDEWVHWALCFHAGLEKPWKQDTGCVCRSVSMTNSWYPTH